MKTLGAITGRERTPQPLLVTGEPGLTFRGDGQEPVIPPVELSQEPLLYQVVDQLSDAFPRSIGHGAKEPEAIRPNRAGRQAL